MTGTHAGPLGGRRAAAGLSSSGPERGPCGAAGFRLLHHPARGFREGKAPARDTASGLLLNKAWG